MSTMPEMAPDIVEGLQEMIGELHRHQTAILQYWSRGRLPLMLMDDVPSEQLKVGLRRFGWRPGMKVCGHPMEMLSMFGRKPSQANPLCLVCIDPIGLLLWESTGGVWHVASHYLT